LGGGFFDPLDLRLAKTIKNILDALPPPNRCEEPSLTDIFVGYTANVSHHTTIDDVQMPSSDPHQRFQYFNAVVRL
jgi:hypothetical protein